MFDVDKLLKCNVHEGRHVVELADWKGKIGNMVDIPVDTRERMFKALDFIAQRRICGNRHICPQQVIDFVKAKEEP